MIRECQRQPTERRHSNVRPLRRKHVCCPSAASHPEQGEMVPLLPFHPPCLHLFHSPLPAAGCQRHGFNSGVRTASTCAAPCTVCTPAIQPRSLPTICDNSTPLPFSAPQTQPHLAQIQLLHPSAVALAHRACAAPSAAARHSTAQHTTAQHITADTCQISSSGRSSGSIKLRSAAAGFEACLMFC